MLERNQNTPGIAAVATRKCGPIRFNKVSLSIAGKPLIDNISCTLNSDGTTVVMGPNGAGKSLFLRLAAGLLNPTSGEITGSVDELDSGEKPVFSMVFQRPALLRRTAFDNIAYVLQQQKLEKSQLINKVDDALKAARLVTCAQIPARHLSGGEQQRLALARALVIEPDALLLDEATASLDPASTQIVEKMADEASINGTKVIFVTHDIKQAKRVADDILFIHSGQVVAHKPAQDFFHDPGSDEAQAYLDGRVPDQSKLI